MHDGGSGLFDQGPKAHTVIGLVTIAESYEQKESGVDVKFGTRLIGALVEEALLRAELRLVSQP